jgi:peptide-methionine (S)-S-oxide reductase
VLGLFSGSGQGAAKLAQDRAHAVLGTPIDAPAGSGQGEVLFGCGCFWGAEKGFWRLPGVETTAVGYAGGSLAQPTYQQVCSGRSGHAEVVRVVWNQEQVHFSDLLKLFWECHDPTQGDRQGNDRGSQYRSTIYVNDPQALALALASREQYGRQLAAAGFGAITTEIRADVVFHPAETYHQQYLAKPGSRPYCSAQPTGILLADFPGCDYQLPPEVWRHFDWSVSHCLLRGDNTPIVLN